MIAGVWGRKIGMTQVFSGNDVVPVTVIDTAHWVITDIKTEERDGYNAIQVGQLKPKFAQEDTFSLAWLKDKKRHFSAVREVPLAKPMEELSIGQVVNLENLMKAGESVDVTGISKGSGFAGVVRRYNFSGGSASHGNRTGKKPGSIGNYCSQGKVVKGKKLPGHMGCERNTIASLEVVSVEPRRNMVLIKGSVPGKPGALVFIRKRGEHGNE